jgi:hypothetical protein
VVADQFFGHGNGIVDQHNLIGLKTLHGHHCECSVSEKGGIKQGLNARSPVTLPYTGSNNNRMKNITI